jgi:TP901 family phage tail tape measure protein
MAAEAEGRLPPQRAQARMAGIEQQRQAAAYFAAADLEEGLRRAQLRAEPIWRRREFAERGIATGLRGQERVFDPALGKVATISTFWDAQTKQLYRYNDATSKLVRLNKEAAASLVPLNKRTQDFGEIIGKVAIWTAATGAVFGSIRLAKSSWQEYAEVEKHKAMLERVSELGPQNVLGVTQDILSLRGTYGVPGPGAFQAATVGARLGMNQEEIRRFTGLSLLTTKLTGAEPGQSAMNLEAMMSQFKLAKNILPQIIDGLVKVDMQSRVTMADLMEAIALTGGVWKQAGGSVQELAASVAVAAESTGRTGSQIGNAIKMISMRLGTPEHQEELFNVTRAAGVPLEVVGRGGEMMPVMQVLDALRERWDKLTESQRLWVTQIVAGQRQSNILTAILQNLGRAQELVNEQGMAGGEAQSQLRRQMMTPQEWLNRLSAEWSNLKYKMVEAVMPGPGYDTTTPGFMEWLGAGGVQDVFAVPGLAEKKLLGSRSGFWNALTWLGTDRTGMTVMEQIWNQKRANARWDAFQRSLRGQTPYERAESGRVQQVGAKMLANMLGPDPYGIHRTAMKDWLEQAEGQKWLATPPGQSFLKTEEGGMLAPAKFVTGIDYKWRGPYQERRREHMFEMQRFRGGEVWQVEGRIRALEGMLRDVKSIKATAVAEDIRKLEEQLEIERSVSLRQAQIERSDEAFRTSRQGGFSARMARYAAAGSQAMHGLEYRGALDPLMHAHMRIAELRSRETIGSEEGAAKDRQLMQEIANLEAHRVETGARLLDIQRQQAEQQNRMLAGLGTEEMLRAKIIGQAIGRGEMGQLTEAQWFQLPEGVRSQLSRFPGIMPQFNFGPPSAFVPPVGQFNMAEVKIDGLDPKAFEALRAAAADLVKLAEEVRKSMDAPGAPAAEAVK